MITKLPDWVYELFDLYIPPIIMKTIDGWAWCFPEEWLEGVHEWT